MAAPVPAYTGTVEKQKLKHAVIGWIDPTISDGGFDHDIIGKAFDNAGIHGYNNLVMLQPNGICYLNVGRTYIPIVKTHKLTAAIAFHHMMSQKIERVFDPRTMTTLEFNNYLTMIYNPTKNIVPWTSPFKEDNPLLKQWLKNVKPSLQDYKEFCEEKCYQLWMQKTVNTIEAHGLEHLIDPNHTPADKKYDKAWWNWLFKAFENTFLAGFARSLVKKYQNTKDT